MDWLLDLFQTWGYLIVLFGAMIEGESIILTACVAAYFGYMSMPKIVIIAFLGTLFADQGLYFLGRKYGNALIQRFPKLEHPAHRAFTLLHRWDIWFILSFRFIYGIRTISPVIIGSAGIPPRRFIPLNFIAAAVWTAISCTGGYLLGRTIDSINFRVIEHYVLMISLTLLAILITVVYVAWKKMHPAQSLDTDKDSSASTPSVYENTTQILEKDHDEKHHCSRF